MGLSLINKVLAKLLYGGDIMEYILELNANHQLTLPQDLLDQYELKPGAHFRAKVDGTNLMIEPLPFSSQEQADLLNKTIQNLQN